MGSQAIQGHLWGQQTKNWATIQEITGVSGYEFVLSLPGVASGKTLLDVGCGSGVFASLAYKKGLAVTGMDASDNMIVEAKLRQPGIDFSTGEMEALPFHNNAFDLVTGFNSFQYAANIKNALQEAKRVLKNNGMLILMIWGAKEACEAATYLKAIGSLLPPPPPGAPGPFALSENNLLETILVEALFNIISADEIPGIWEYQDTETAIKGLLSAGPAAKAIENSGFEKAYDTISEAILPYVQPNGTVIYHNKYRIVVAGLTV